MSTINTEKLEALKVWYALFTTIMDASEQDSWKFRKLASLREQIKKEAPGLESN